MNEVDPFSALSWAFGQKVSPSEKFTLVTMALFADSHGYVDTPASELAMFQGVSKKTVQRNLLNLDASGVIQGFRRYDKVTGARVENAFRLYQVKNAPLPFRKYSYLKVVRGLQKDVAKAA